MSSRTFIFFFLSIFCLGAMPIAIIQPTGIASEGLNAGFVMPLEQPVFAILCVIAGLLASLIGRNSHIYMSISLLAMLVVGHVINYDVKQFSLVPYIILSSILLLILIAGVTVKRAELLGILIAASLGFQLGMHSMFIVSDTASALYFLLGILLSVTMLLATSISLGMALLSEDWQLGRILRDSQRLDGFRSLFR